MKHPKQDFYDHLDGKTPRDVDAETQEMLELLREVESLPTADPGPDYWNQFNREFQQRLAQAERKSRWQLRWLFPVLASAAVVLVAYVTIPLLQQPEAQQVPTLADLSPESLAMVEAFYLPENDDYLIVEETYADDLLTGDLYESYETLYQDESYGLEGLEAEQLESIWNMEG